MVCSRCHVKKPLVAMKAAKTCWLCFSKKIGAHSPSPDWREANRAHLQKYNKQWRGQAKGIVLKHYGGKCRCCGEDDIRFLTIDHKDGKGTQHRKQLGVKAGPPFYSWLIKNNFPLQYAVLCCNCNWGRFLNGGICPHKSDKVTVENARRRSATSPWAV